MIKEHREIVVPQAREAVFEFLTDETKLSTWVDGIVSIEPFGEPSEGLGSKARFKINVPVEMEIVSTTTEWEPPHRVAWSVDVAAMASTQTYTLEPVAEGTQITLDVEHRLKGFLMNLMSPLISWQIKSARAKEMVRLRQVLSEL